MKLTTLRGAMAALLLGIVASASAQNYPAGPIRIIVPFPAGGGVDTAGRLLGQKLSEAIGRPVLIDNRAGANGMIGSEMVAKAPKDGYTLMVNGANFVTSPTLYAKSLYDPIKDFDAISLLAHAPNILVVHPSMPVKNVRELIAFAKARPGEVLFAGSGSGSTPHLAGELFKTQTGTKMVHVMPALTALPLIQSGRVRALGVTSLERLPALPELPTVSESGLKGYQSSQWYGVLAPAGTSPDILNLLNGHAVKIMQSADMKERMKNSGSVAVGSSREVFAKFLQTEYSKWAQVIKTSGAIVD